jgi:hypothetical protein
MLEVMSLNFRSINLINYLKKIKMYLLLFLSALGLSTLKFSRIATLIQFFQERKKFIKLGGIITGYRPMLTDYRDNAGVAKGHYFHQDLLVARLIFEDNPKRHIDLASRIDGFVAHVASFRKIEVFDIRALKKSEHPNIIFSQLDIASSEYYEITDSISSLHVIEHFGLGRYGDKLDPKGHIVGFENLISMVKPKGRIYVSFPIGSQNQVHFNAHRIFHPKDIFSWTSNDLSLLRFDYVDDHGQLFENFDIINHDIKEKLVYGCGIYTFQKN